MGGGGHWRPEEPARRSEAWNFQLTPDKARGGEALGVDSSPAPKDPVSRTYLMGPPHAPHREGVGLLAWWATHSGRGRPQLHRDRSPALGTLPDLIPQASSSGRSPVSFVINRSSSR